MEKSIIFAVSSITLYGIKNENYQVINKLLELLKSKHIIAHHLSEHQSINSLQKCSYTSFNLVLAHN